jgi:pyruvate dehydrogenase E1 component
MTEAQMETFRAAQGIAPGEEWEPFSGDGMDADALRAFLAAVPFAAPLARHHAAARIAVPAALAPPASKIASTQEGFGRILVEIARAGGALADRLVTASPDVTVSTNLGGWVNRRGVFDHRSRAAVVHLQEVTSAQKWEVSPRGQHIELGIAENNLFLLLAALGLAGPLFGARLLPVGTLYDPFIARGLDALNYACYQDARFLLVATPSGVTLAPEGGAHQSIVTPLIGIGQPGLLAYEPAYIDELAEIVRFALEYMQADDGGSVYLRLSTRPLQQLERAVTPELRAAWIYGGSWLEAPASGAELALAYTGVVAPEAREAFESLREDVPGLGLLSITSADRLHAGWRAAQRARAAGDVGARAPIERLLADLAADATLVTVLDGHPATLSWLGAVAGHRVVALGVDRFGQSADVPDLYRAHGLSADAIVEAVARALLDRTRGPAVAAKG